MGPRSVRSQALSSVFRPGSGEDWSVLWSVLREWIGAGGLLLLVAALAAWPAADPAPLQGSLVEEG